jgi:hypothetical protein
MVDHDASPDREPGLSTDQKFQLILEQLRNPTERQVKLESEVHQIRSLLEEEVSSRKDLSGELQRLAREFGETMDRRMDRAFKDCREDRDLRLSHLAERVSTIQCLDREERSHSVKMRIAVFSAISALVISILNAVIGIVTRL